MAKPIDISAEEKSALDWIETRADGMAATLKDWVRINSGSRNADGLERMRGELERVFAETGGRITAVDLPPLPLAARSTYRKVRDRASYAFALVSVAVNAALAIGLFNLGMGIAGIAAAKVSRKKNFTRA